MNYRFIQAANGSYLSCDSGAMLETEQDGMDLIGACWEMHTNRLLLHADILSDAFFQLRSGLAGSVLQKFVNYHIQTAIVIPPDRQLSDRVKEWFSELNKGREFSVFAAREEAEQWLAGSNG